MMEEQPERMSSMNRLCIELAEECSKTHDLSKASAVLTSISDFERKVVLEFLFWYSLRVADWRLADSCIGSGIAIVPDQWCDQGPIHTALSQLGDRHDVIAWLIDHGAEVDRRGPSNTTPLMIAVGGGMAKCIEVLIEKGAEVNLSTVVDDDLTPLMIAASVGDKNTVMLLIQLGAAVDRKNRWGRDASDCARIEGHEELAMLLRNRERKRGGG